MKNTKSHKCKPGDILVVEQDLTLSPAETGNIMVPASHDRLFNVFYDAFSQSAFGKGQERHGQQKNFEDQPMLQIVSMLGDKGTGFTIGQAIKKLQEASRMDPHKAIHEMKGAMVYIAGTIMALQDKMNDTIAGELESADVQA